MAVFAVNRSAFSSAYFTVTIDFSNVVPISLIMRTVFFTLIWRYKEIRTNTYILYSLFMCRVFRRGPFWISIKYYNALISIVFDYIFQKLISNHHRLIHTSHHTQSQEKILKKIFKDFRRFLAYQRSVALLS